MSPFIWKIIPHYIKQHICNVIIPTNELYLGTSHWLTYWKLALIWCSFNFQQVHIWCKLILNLYICIWNICRPPDLEQSKVSIYPGWVVPLRRFINPHWSTTFYATSKDVMHKRLNVLGMLRATDLLSFLPTRLMFCCFNEASGAIVSL